MKLAITANVTAVDDSGKSLKYMFKISPQVEGTGEFMFLTYCGGYEREPGNTTERTILAKQLREKHAACWRRYHEWFNTLKT